MQAVESSYMQDLQAAPARALEAPPVDTKHSLPLHTPSLHLLKKLPSQRLGRSGRAGQLGATPRPPNWYSSSQRSTVLPQPQLLNSNPMHIPLQEKGPVGLQERSPVSVSSLFLLTYKVCVSSLFLLTDGLNLFFIPILRDRWNGPAL